MSKRHCALLVAVILLAGCGGVFGGTDGGTTTPTGTEPPIPPTETTASEPIPSATTTATPTERAFDPAVEQRYRALNDRVRNNTVSLIDSRIVNETTVGYLVDQNTNTTLERMFRGDAMPVPQAIALEMADMNRPPERAVFHILDREQQHIFTVSFTVDEARAYENRTLMPDEFRNLLTERGTVFNDASRDSLQTLFVWETGDRARHSYTKGIVEASRDSRFGTKLNITDAGLHNASYEFRDSDVSVEPNASIYITVQHPRDGGNESYGYGFFSEDLRAATNGILFEKWGRAAYGRPFGNPPGGLQIRYIDRENTLYRTYVTSDNHGYAYENGNIGPIGLLRSIKSEQHNGGSELEQREQGRG
jgi:hypothetical protein